MTLPAPSLNKYSIDVNRAGLHFFYNSVEQMFAHSCQFAYESFIRANFNLSTAIQPDHLNTWLLGDNSRQLQTLCIVNSQLHIAFLRGHSEWSKCISDVLTVWVVHSNAALLWSIYQQQRTRATPSAWKNNKAPLQWFKCYFKENMAGALIGQCSQTFGPFVCICPLATCISTVKT